MACPCPGSGAGGERAGPGRAGPGAAELSRLGCEVVALDFDASQNPQGLCGDFTDINGLERTVEAVQPDVIVNAAGSSKFTKGDTVDMPLSASAASTPFSNLGLATNIAAFHADERFKDVKGKGVSVVVVDTGIDLNHPHFGPDADRNGIADRIVFNYDFVGANDNNASDGQGHGTHVAGTVGSSDANYLGAAPEVNIIALRVLGDDGSGTGADIMEALNWVVANASRYNVVAVNLSLGDSSFDTSSREGYLSTQFKALTNAGVVVVGLGTGSTADFFIAALIMDATLQSSLPQKWGSIKFSASQVRYLA